jgi:heme exporter protein D
MDRIAAFFAMGGYAPFVWGAFGVTAATMAGLAVLSRRSLREKQRALRMLLDQMEHRRHGGDAAA